MATVAAIPGAATAGAQPVAPPVSAYSFGGCGTGVLTEAAGPDQPRIGTVLCLLGSGTLQRQSGAPDRTLVEFAGRLSAEASPSLVAPSGVTYFRGTTRWEYQGPNCGSVPCSIQFGLTLVGSPVAPGATGAFTFTSLFDRPTAEVNLATLRLADINGTFDYYIDGPPGRDNRRLTTVSPQVSAVPEPSSAALTAAGLAAGAWLAARRRRAAGAGPPRTA